MSETTQGLRQDAFAALDLVEDEADLAGWYRDVLGRKGSLSEALKGLAGLDADARRERGRELNELKRQLEAAFATRQEAIKSQSLDA
ncbi:MAG TPA: hypothetical protein PKA95_10685, partial [Thermomicrobiales bacterium]|nr:hypothetical protein [Thermomicrobiales bacterium]